MADHHRRRGRDHLRSRAALFGAAAVGSQSNLWCGYIVQSRRCRDPFCRRLRLRAAFRGIGERFPSIDVALLPIGAYEPRWFMAPVHMNPDEAVRAHLDLRPRVSIGMHFGTFQLTDEAIDDPLHALERARTAPGVNGEAFKVLDFGGGGDADLGELQNYGLNRKAEEVRRNFFRRKTKKPTAPWYASPPCEAPRSARARWIAPATVITATQEAARQTNGGARRLAGIAHQSFDERAAESATPRMRGKRIVPAEETHSSSGRDWRKASASASCATFRARAVRVSRCWKASVARRSVTI